MGDDAGRSWRDVTGNLVAATKTIARARPNGVLLIEFEQHGFRCLLVGTVNGVFVSFSDDKHLGKWTRLGGKEFPLVLNYGLSYEHYSDTLVAATYGRGVYILHNAREVLLAIHEGNDSLTAELKTSARFFPMQQACTKDSSSGGASFSGHFNHIGVVSGDED